MVSLAAPFMLRTADNAALAPDTLTMLISAVGLIIVVASKITLGRSFGLVPANRGVVVRGPYTFVRHPIYAGYLVTPRGVLPRASDDRGTRRSFSLATAH